MKYNLEKKSIYKCVHDYSLFIEMFTSKFQHLILYHRWIQINMIISMVNYIPLYLWIWFSRNYQYTLCLIVLIMTVIFGIYLRYYRIEWRKKCDTIRTVNPIEIRFPTYFPLLMCSNVRDLRQSTFWVKWEWPYVMNV